MSNLDPRVESKAHHLCHVLAESIGRPLNDKERHDVFHTIRSVADYWKPIHDKHLKDNYHGIFNETKFFLDRNPHASPNDTKQFMLQLQMDGITGARNINVK